MGYQYKIGKASFATKEAKEKWILEGILLNLEYIGMESSLSPTEKDLRRLSISRLKSVIKTKKG